MAPAKPMLGEIELQLVQKLDTEQDQTLSQHSVPALEGDFLQRLGRRASRFVLSGVMTGPESADDLKTLRDRFRAGDPVSFVSDIATATKVDQVIIEELVARELAGKPERFTYTVTLRELLTPPENVVEDEVTPQPPDESEPELPDPEVGTLEVELNVEGAPDIDFGSVTVAAETTDENGVSSTRTLTNRTENIWTESNLPPGQYTVRARTTEAPQADTAGADSLQPQPSGALSDAPPIEALGTGQVQGGQTTQVQLQASVTAPVATMFVVHFRFDKSFVEPCDREVLRQAIEFSNQPGNTSLKLLVVGHADKSGPPDYNQSLSERRARAVYAFLTFGRDETPAFNDWDNLRLNPRTGRTDLNDRWELRHAQHMLQDLNYYVGNVDNRDGRLTQEAIRAFRCHKGLPPGTNLDDDVWRALIRDYLKQDSFAVPTSRFLTNCPNEILKWLGCGEDDPLRNTSAPHRPSRRVELLFVNASALPCQVPQPTTFDLPAPGGAVNSGWCVGGPGASSRTCFVSTHLEHNSNTARPCSPSPTGPWCRRPAEPGTINVQGGIFNEDGTPAARQPFVITTPGGEFLAREDGAGEPVQGTTSGSGQFSFSGKPLGFYSIAVLSKSNQPELLVKLEGAGDETIRGNVACKALRSDSDRLNVVIVAAPLLREIVLPVVVHLITTTEFQQPNAPRSPVAYSSARTAVRVRSGFVIVNRIWRQARVRFDVVDVVHRTLQRINPLIDPPGPTMSSSDFNGLLIHDTYPGVVNVFVAPDVQTSNIAGEGGAAIAPEESASHGVAVEDLLTSSPATGSRPLSDEPWAKITAHELGHYLHLTYGTASHPDQEPGAVGPFDTRLMRSSVDLNTTNDTHLIDSEIQQARASLAAAAECQPLVLTVTGAEPLGGRFSSDFIVARATTGDVTIEATGEPSFIARGTVTWTGATVDPSNPQRSTVSRNATPSPVTVVAELLGVTRRVRIFVVDFPELTVQGPGQMAAGTTNYFVRRDASPAAPRLRIIARPTPTPHAVPDDIVIWNNTTDAAPESPLERLLSINAIPNAPVVVTATVAGVTRTVTIAVLEVALVSNDPPGTVAVDPVLIEGVINDDRRINRGTFALADLVSTQARSLFRARAELPGVAGGSVQGFLISRDSGGRQIERVAVTLQRTAGNVFVTQRPHLVIPEIITRADVQTVDLDFVLARAGGTLRLELTGFADQAQTQVRTRGRVVTLNVTAFRGSGITRADIDTNVLRAQQTWAQAGMEIEAPVINVNIAAPAGVLDMDHTDNTGQVLTADEQALVGLAPAMQPRENVIHIFYVRDILDPTANSDVQGIAFPNNPVIALQGHSVQNNSAFPHEIGHQLLINWGGNEHQDHGGTDWPRENVMHPENTSDGRDVDRTQAENIVRESIRRRFHHLVPP